MLKNRFVLTALAAGILAVPAISADAPGFYKVPGTDTQMQVYGFVLAESVLDLTGNSGVNGAFGSAADNATPKGTWDMAINNSHVGTKTITSTDGGDIKTTTQLGFYKVKGGKNDTVFFRKAFAEYNGWKIGRDGSNFFDPNETIEYLAEAMYADFWGPCRQLMIQYSGDVNKQTSYSFSIEDVMSGEGAPYSIEQANPKTNPAINQVNKLPGAVTGRLNYSDKWGHIGAAVAYQQVANFVNDATGNHTDTVGILSFTIGGHFQFGDDSLGWNFQNGCGYYGTSVQDMPIYDTSNNLTTIRANAYELGYTHAWSPKVRSNLYGGLVTNTQDDTKAMNAASGAFKSYTQIAADVIYGWSKTSQFGVEYIYGTQKPFDNSEIKNPDGSNGSITESKLMFSYKVNFF